MSPSRGSWGRSARSVARLIGHGAAVALVVTPLSSTLPGSSVLAQPTLETWTQFQGGPSHTGAVEGGPGPAFTESWSLEEPLGGPTGNEGLSQVAVANGIATTVSPDSVIAIDVQTGAERWRIDRASGPTVPPAIVGDGADALVVFPEGSGPNRPSGATPTSAPTSPSSPSSSPSLSADGGESESDVDLVAVTLADGSEAWRSPLPGPSRSGVTASGDAVYVGGNDGTVTALDATDGSQRWSEPVGPGAVGPLAVADELVLASALGDDDTSFAVVALRTSDGSQAWRYEPDVPSAFGTPASVADGVAYVAFDDRTLRAVDLGSGEERWLARLNGIVSPTASPVVVGDVVVVADVGGQVYAIDRTTGTRRWDHALNVGFGNARSASVATGPAVLVPTVAGELYAVELESGDLIWSGDVADGLLRSLAVADELLIGVRSGSRPGLVALRHDPDGSLVRIESPTTFDPGGFAADLALAAVPFVVVLLVLGRVLGDRLGPVTLGSTDPSDPIEDEGDGGAA